MDGQEANNHEITNADILEFLKDHMVMNEDFKDEMKKVDERFQQVATKKDIERLDARLVEMQRELEEIRTRLDDIEQRLKDDTDALAKEVVQLRKRVTVLEQKLGLAQPQTSFAV